jgi:hypothetical protein
MGDVGIAFWLHNVMRFKQWAYRTKTIGLSQQQEFITYGRPNLPGNYVNNVGSYKKTGLWVDPNFVSMNF